MIDWKIIVGNYNMSWFTGDSTKDVPESPYSGKPPISEYPWVRYIYDVDTAKTGIILSVDNGGNVELRCKYWLNALNHLQRFINAHKPGMVGLQEININHENATIDGKQKFPEFGSLTNQPEMVHASVGSKGIETMLDNVNETNQKKNVQSNYKLLCGRVASFGAWVGICIIYDENQVGSIINTKIIDNHKQPGRPLLMARTDKGFLLASMHGAQDGTLGLNTGYEKGVDKGAFNAYIIANNQKFFETECAQFITETNATIMNCFLATDLNDRYDAVNELTLNYFKMSYYGDAPITTAPNWDSAAPANNPCLKTTQHDGTLISLFTCLNPTDKPTEQGVHVLTINHAMVDNYLYRGDKVFGTGSNGSSDIVIFKSPDKQEIGEDGVSRASDHRLVYASFNVTAENIRTTMTASGGRRTRRHKKRVYNSYKRTHRRRKTRKTRKQTHVNKYKK